MDKIEFIIPTYNRTNHLITLVGSLMSQSNPNWTCHIVADCPPEDVQEKIRTIVSFFNDERIKLTILPERHNDWGHTPRQYGLDNATERWVCMTGEDNYYVPHFVEKMLDGGTNSNFVYCDLVHDWVNKDYIPIKSILEYGRIDIGNFIVKNSIARKIRLKKKFEHADWLFVEEYIQTQGKKKINKVDGVLYVHN